MCPPLHWRSPSHCPPDELYFRCGIRTRTRTGAARRRRAFFMKLNTLAILAGFFFAVASIAQAEQYVDRSGFSFNYPSGWVAYANPATAKLPAELRSRLDRNRTELGKLSVMLFHRAKSDSTENISVSVAPETSLINDASLRELKMILPQEGTARGIRIDRMRGAIQDIGGHKAIVIEFDSRVPALSVPMHQCQFYLSSGGKTYIITCTALASDFDQLTPAFGQILLSFQMPTSGQ
jgi:hypothetical protein